MPGYSYTVIVGHVGGDPELRYTSSGVAVCDFSVAVSRKFGAGEDRKEETVWFRVTCWRQLAEIANEYVVKGKQVMVAGRVSAEAYIAKDGTARASLNLTAQDLQLLGRKDDGGAIETEEAPF